MAPDGFSGSWVSTRVRIRCSALPGGVIEAELENSPTLKALLPVLPHTSKASTWGAEVYFPVPIEAELDSHPKQVVPRGTVCFWVQGASLAIPYGPTPISEGNESRLVTAVNVLGSIVGESGILATIRDGDTITIELAE